MKSDLPYPSILFQARFLTAVTLQQCLEVLLHIQEDVVLLWEEEKSRNIFAMVIVETTVVAEAAAHDLGLDVSVSHTAD